MFHSHIRVAVIILLIVSSQSLRGDDAPKEMQGIAFRLAETELAEGLAEVVVPGVGRKLFLHPKDVLTHSDVTSVTFARDEHGDVAVTLKIEAAAAKRLAVATKSHFGKPMAILLDGKVIVAPVVRSELSTTAQITGRFSDAELTRMFSALVLHSESPDPEK